MKQEVLVSRQFKIKATLAELSKGTTARAKRMDEMPNTKPQVCRSDTWAHLIPRHEREKHFLLEGYRASAWATSNYGALCALPTRFLHLSLQACILISVRYCRLLLNAFVLDQQSIRNLHLHHRPHGFLPRTSCSICSLEPRRKPKAPVLRYKTGANGSCSHSNMADVPTCLYIRADQTIRSHLANNIAKVDKISFDEPQTIGLLVRSVNFAIHDNRYSTIPGPNTDGEKFDRSSELDSILESHVSSSVFWLKYPLRRIEYSPSTKRHPSPPSQRMGLIA